MPNLPPPALVTFEPDYYHAEHVSVTADGRQFFLNNPFVGAYKEEPGSEFIALYVFHADGQLASVTLDDFGPRATLDREARIRRRDALLASLGDYRHEAIRIAPFEVEAWGITFGLVLNHFEDEGEERWQAIAEPGNYMCFWAAWTDGLYDT